MVFAVPVECGEHDGEDGGGVVADQAHDVPDDQNQDDVPCDQEKQLTHYSSNRELSQQPERFKMENQELYVNNLIYSYKLLIKLN